MPITIADEFGIIRREKDYTGLTSLASPEWAKNSIIYEVYIRSFSKDGTFSSLIKKLPELKELGVDIIWLMPIHTIGYLKRKGPLGSPYAVRDHYRINPEYGKKDHFKELIEEIHKSGMHIILDFVANHAANDHVEKKEHSDWFIKDEKGNFTRRIAGWSDVIDFNYENKELRNYVKNALLFWVKEYDIDGYRCDVAGMVPEDFWLEVREELMRIRPDIFLVAEWEDPEMHLRTFNVTYDWVLYYKLFNIYKGVDPASEIIDLLLKREAEFPSNALRLHFLENHDQARTSYKFGVTSFYPFVAFIFTINGIPLIYNGQEVGDTKYLSLFDKNPINWKIRGATKIRQFYKTLINLRKQFPVFFNGSTIKIDNDSSNEIVTYCRKNDRQEAIVVLNFSDKERNVKLDFKTDRDTWQVFDILTFEIQERNIKDWSFSMEPYGGFILYTD